MMKSRICYNIFLMQIIEQAYRPHSSVEWHFACSMRSKWRHRAGTSALQPPGMPLALLDVLHEECFGRAFFRRKTMKPTQKGRFLRLYSVMISCRKAPTAFRFASSTLRNFVPSGAAHEAAAGHALSEPSDNYPAATLWVSLLFRHSCRRQCL